MWDYDENVPAWVPKSQPQPQNTIPLPDNVKYLVIVHLAGGGQTHYFSEYEPKAFGSGYKIKDVRGLEVTVSGQVEIIKVKK